MFPYFRSMQVCYSYYLFFFMYIFYCCFRFLLYELSPILSPKIIVAQKLPIIKAESRWKTVINSVVSSIKTKKNVRNHKARNQHLPLQNILNNEVSNIIKIFY